MALGVLFNTDRLDQQQFLAYGQKIEALGYESLWLPELFTRDPYAAAGILLGQTKRLKLASGIANIYGRDPQATVAGATTLQELSNGRFILGLGVSNAGLNQARGHQWQKPLSKLENYLSAMQDIKLTSPQIPVPIAVAAHGPKMLALTAKFGHGANTYLMPQNHVAFARDKLGADLQLNTMLFCLLESDPNKARQTARKAIQYYLGLDYYHRAWRDFGFEDSDFKDGGSDRLIDEVVAWGDIDAINHRISNQFDQGASRVVIIPLGAGQGGAPNWELLEQVAQR